MARPALRYASHHPDQLVESNSWAAYWGEKTVRWGAAPSGLRPFTPGIFEAQRQSLGFEWGHATASEFVGAFIFWVACVAFDPFPCDFVTAGSFV